MRRATLPTLRGCSVRHMTRTSTSMTASPPCDAWGLDASSRSSRTAIRHADRPLYRASFRAEGALPLDVHVRLWTIGRHGTASSSTRQAAFVWMHERREARMGQNTRIHDLEKDAPPLRELARQELP